MKNILITCIGCAPASAIARSLTNNYNVIGIDMQKECIGTFICNKFIQITDKFNSIDYWNEIKNIIVTENIDFIFVSLPFEIEEWSKRKHKFNELYKCEILLNDIIFCDITNSKEKTYNFCIENNIRIPTKKYKYERPIIIKKLRGCGSEELQILKTHTDEYLPFKDDDFIIQEYIDGIEYTVDVLSNPNGNIVCVVPKKRCLIKNGQAFKSITEKNVEVIKFVTDVCLKFNNKCAINVQVIQEKYTNDIYLIEINPRFPTSISLTIKSDVNIPQMLVDRNFKEKDFENNLMMIRDYKEYFINNNQIISEFSINERDCLIDTHEKNIKASNLDKYIFIELRKNINKFLASMKKLLINKKNVLEIGEYWGDYIGAKTLYKNINIKSLDIDNDHNPDYCMDITKRTKFNNETFDSIICLEVLEHTRNPFDAIKEITRILQRNGLLFISVPCNYRIHSPFPDSWRFTHHSFKVIAEDYNYKIIKLNCIELNERLLFPLHYTCILQKL